MADDVSAMEKKKPRIVPLPGRDAGRALGPATSTPAQRPRLFLRSILMASFALCVLLPSALGTIYYAFIASDRYVAGAGFAVRGMDGAGGSDLLGSFTGLASVGSTTSDSYILLKYLKSRDIVERLETTLPLRRFYTDNGGDFLSRLSSGLDIEQVVEYWQNRISTAFDSTSGVITFEIDAFRPEDSRLLAVEVLKLAQGLVNELSRQARSDAVAHAREEVARAELRLKTALDSMRRFRESKNAFDPAGSARLQLELIGGLERQLAEYRTRIAALQRTVDEASPMLRNLLRQADAVEAQIEAQKADTIIAEEGGGARLALAGQLANYETLEVERNFAQQAYTSALSSLEKARVEAGRQQRYLAIYSEPALPQYPIYPRRLLNILLLFTGLALLWGIGAMIVYAVRDHMT